jgi:AraC-like DNA-binding protein
MKILETKENTVRGSRDFPIESYYISKDNSYWYSIPAHWHEEDEIIIITNGKLHYEIGSEKGTAETDDILYVNSGMIHSTLPDPESDCVYICIVFDLFSFTKNDIASGEILQSLINGDINISLRLSDYGDEQIRLIIRQLERVLSKKINGNALQIHGLLFTLLGNIIHNGYYYKTTDIPPTRKSISKLKYVLSVIENNYHMPLTLQMLADEAEMSTKYFCYFFKQMTHFTPIEYLNKHRIEVACYRLMSGEKNITELAYACGFNEVSYFIRVFKKITGLTPKQYNKNLIIDAL